jgi:type IV pilus assembly protein PilO
MAFLPNDPKDQQRLLGIILPIALVALFYFYLYRPRGAELLDLEERISDMEAQNEVARARTAALDGLREDLVLAERRFAALERLVPTGEEIPEIYEAIASESEALRLNMRNVIPIEAEADSGEYFMRQNWEMEIEGSYHDIGRFLSRVASFDRIVRSQVREIRPVQGASEGDQPVTIYFELETFVLPLDSGSAGESGGGE